MLYVMPPTTCPNGADPGWKPPSAPNTTDWPAVSGALLISVPTPSVSTPLIRTVHGPGGASPTVRLVIVTFPPHR